MDLYLLHPTTIATFAWLIIYQIYWHEQITTFNISLVVHGTVCESKSSFNVSYNASLAQIFSYWQHCPNVPILLTAAGPTRSLFSSQKHGYLQNAQEPKKNNHHIGGSKNKGQSRNLWGMYMLWILFSDRLQDGQVG